MEHQELLDSVALHAFGALEDAERIELEAHLADGCATCGAALREALEVSQALGAAPPRVEPSPRVRAALRARIGATSERRERSWLRALPLAAALAAAVLAGGQAWRLATSLEGERAARAAAERSVAELRGEIERARSEGGELAQRAEHLQELVQVLTARDTRSVALAGQPAAPAASARAYLSPDTKQLLLFAYDLPPTPPGQTYQLWVIVEGKPPISAGVFEITADGRARHDAFTPPEVRGPVTIAVSVEPAGGVPAPTGPIVLAGS